MKRKITVAAGIVLRTYDVDSVLLLWNRWRRRWEWPGGKAEKTDATLRATAVRETLEETGLVVPVDHYLGTVQLPPTNSPRRRRYVHYSTYGTWVPTEQRVRVDNVVHTAARWVPVAYLDAYLAGELLDRLRSYLGVETWPVARQAPMW